LEVSGGDLMAVCGCDQNEVRSQDTVFVIAGVTGSVDGRELAWKFVCDNWSILHARYSGIFLLSRLIKVGLLSVQNQSSVDCKSKL